MSIVEENNPLKVHYIYIKMGIDTIQIYLLMCIYIYINLIKIRMRIHSLVFEVLVKVKLIIHQIFKL